MNKGYLPPRWLMIEEETNKNRRRKSQRNGGCFVLSDTLIPQKQLSVFKALRRPYTELTLE